MEVCSSCIVDKELKALINSTGKIGKCQVCGASASKVIELDELKDFFQELVNNFHLSDNGIPLKEIIQSKWSFFKSHDATSLILDEILEDLETDISSSIDLVDYTDEIKENIGYWDVLKHDLKWKRRYFPDIDKLQELEWDGFFNTQFNLSSEIKLYRGRVHHESKLEPYSTDNMLSPQPEKTKAGRANPLGIPYLYLCDNPDTVLYEIRASYLDELSLGTFQVKETIKKMPIVDFIEDTSLYRPSLVKETINARLLKDKISLDLSKPMRRYDSEIEYIPTQFICEFIRVYTGAGGIRFKSSLHPKGNNFVIFEESSMECIEVKKKKVSRLKLCSESLK